MNVYAFNNHALLRFHETLKDAIDPNGICVPRPLRHLAEAFEADAGVRPITDGHAHVGTNNSGTASVGPKVT